MRISDWSSDVCSSDLDRETRGDHEGHRLNQSQTRARQRRIVRQQEAQLGPLVALVPLAVKGRRQIIEIKSHPVGLVCLGGAFHQPRPFGQQRSEEHTSELPSLMRISYAVFCLNKKKH